jgi:UDP-glucose-4-epimerase GalE
MKILITGGAGYIGSHAVYYLQKLGYIPIIVDNLSRGDKRLIPNNVNFYNININETYRISQILIKENIDAVIHFAAYADVGESVKNPLMYYQNNFVGTLSLLQAMNYSGVDKLIFSSTCATYGQPNNIPVTESEIQSPINPYGKSKYFIEQAIQDNVNSGSGLNAIILRYFNVAGYSKNIPLIKRKVPETRLIPLAIASTLGLHPKLIIFGDDYNTPDGTCVRDYIDVRDLVNAHIKALESNKIGYNVYNLGIGKGFSVKEVINSVSRVTGKNCNYIVGDPREGDPAIIYSSNEKIIDELNWKPNYTNLDEIVASYYEKLK